MRVKRLNWAWGKSRITLLSINAVRVWDWSGVVTVAWLIIFAEESEMLRFLLYRDYLSY